MQSVCSSAVHAGIRGVSPSPPMPQSPTTKIAHIQSDGRSRARQACKISSLVGPKQASRSVQDLCAGRSKTASGRCKIALLVDARRPRVGKQGFAWLVVRGLVFAETTRSRDRGGASIGVLAPGRCS
jgi:hypothetical protein